MKLRVLVKLTFKWPWNQKVIFFILILWSCLSESFSFYFKWDILVLFLHNSYGTSEFPDCGNLVGADCMGNLRWANTEPSMHFRKTNTDPSVHLRKANTDPSMQFRKANTEFLLQVLLPTPNFTSKFTPRFIPYITINLLDHDEYNIIFQVTVN